MASTTSDRYLVHGIGPSRSTRVLWTLEEVGADYDYAPIDFSSGGLTSPAYTALNPGAKVPTLVHGDFVLTESAAICTYIADQHPEAGLIPEPRTRARAQHDQWASFVITELEQALWTKAKHTFVLPEALRVPEVVPTAEKEFFKAAAVLAKALADGRPYLLGESFQVVDILAGHTLAWATRGAGLTLDDEIITAYAGRTLGRPALARAAAREATA